MHSGCKLNIFLITVVWNALIFNDYLQIFKSLGHINVKYSMVKYILTYILRIVY